MQRSIVAIIGSLSIFFIFAAFAQENDMQYQQRTLPDGSTETHYSQTNGAKIKQIHRQDGTMEIDATDENGNETITITHPNGTVDVKNVSK